MTWRILPSNVQCSRDEGQSQLGAVRNTHGLSVCLDFSQPGSSILGWGQTFQEIQAELHGLCLPIFGIHMASLRPRPVLTVPSSDSRREMTSLPSLHRRLARSHCITICGNEITDVIFLQKNPTACHQDGTN